jgi:hypothetical protein
MTIAELHCGAVISARWNVAAITNLIICHCEQSEAIQLARAAWIASSLRSSQ